MSNETYFGTNSYSEEDFIMLSALQHYLYCPRQCALIHVEQVWAENLFTAEGRVMHDKADSNTCESRGNVRIEYSVPMRSLRLGLVAKADVVEFHRKENGTWLPFPVEYKRGKPKLDDCDRVQLCAQALCLEEMLNVEIREGALFYGKTRRRENIRFDAALRQETEETVRNVRELVQSGRSPRAEYSKKCEKCSLLAICIPKTCGKTKPVGRYLLSVMGEE